MEIGNGTYTRCLYIKEHDLTTVTIIKGKEKHKRFAKIIKINIFARQIKQRADYGADCKTIPYRNSDIFSNHP